MQELDHLTQGISQALFSALIDASFKAAVIFGLTSIACLLMRKRSAAMRHGIWSMALIGAVLVPVLTASLPRFEFAILPAESNHLETRPADTVVQDSNLVQAQLAAFEMTTQTVVEPGSHSPFVESLPRGSASVLRNFLARIWFAGVLLLGVPFLLAITWQSRRLGSLPTVLDSEWNATIHQLCKQLGLTRRVTTLQAQRGAVPAVFGIWRAVLVVPDDWHDWNTQQRDCILLHELTHIKRYDVAVQLLGRLVAVVYWFNPLAWYALRQLHHERELACDDGVLSAGKRASDYAEYLLQTLRNCRTQQLALGVAMAHSSRLDQRVLAILAERQCRAPFRRKQAALIGIPALLLLAVVTSTTLSVRRATASGRTPETLDHADDVRETAKTSPTAVLESETLTEDETPFVIVPVTTPLQLILDKRFRDSSVCVVLANSQADSQFRKPIPSETQSAIRRQLADLSFTFSRPRVAIVPMRTRKEATGEAGFRIDESRFGQLHPQAFPSSSMLFDEDWSQLSRELRDQALHGGDSNLEQGIGDESVTVYPVQTPLSRVLFGDVDCVIHIHPPIEQAPDTIVKTMQTSVAQLNLPRRKTAAFVIHWKTLVGADAAEERFCGVQIYRDLLGFEDRLISLRSP